MGTNRLSAITPISEANFFRGGLAVQLTFKKVSGLVIEANFFSLSSNQLE